MKEIELIEKRGRREKHFLQEDGTILAKVYSDDIHYKKNGKHEEIDNTLMKKDGYYQNKSNDYQVKFPENGKKSLMQIVKEDNYLDIKLKNANNTKAVKRKKVSQFMEDVFYENVLEDVSVEYQALPTKIKETMVLQNSSQTEFTFTVDTNLLLEKSNNCILAKKDNKVVFAIERPYMKDSKEELNYNVEYNLRKTTGGYELDLVLDKKWLMLETTKYPVYVDPTITNQNQAGSMQDTYIYPGDTNDTRSNKEFLKAGVEKVNNQIRPNRTLIKFSLPTLGTGSEIVSANLDLTSYPSTTTYPPYRVATMHRITSDWNEENANWNNMGDKYEPRVESMFYGRRSTISSDNKIVLSSSEYGDITSLVKKWYRDTPNYGIMLKSVDEAKYVDDDYPAFYSKDNNISGENNPKPIFTLAYRNHNGLENYLDYKKQSFTDGNAYLNTYNGNLTTVFNLGHTVGGNLPVSLDLIYNTNDVILSNETFFKKGFKLNLEQTIKEISIDNNNYLEYLDEDGTIHYLKREANSSNYQDEDGLNLMIEKTDTLCTMTDNNNNVMVFSKVEGIYRLTKITDTDGNSVEITLNSDNSISKVSDKFGAEVNIFYNANSINIISPATTTVLNYSNNQLTSIETLNGITSFEYNSHNLISSITDITGLKIKYEYYSNLPYRMKKVISVGLNAEEGEYFTLKYGFDSTSIIDNKEKITTLIYNSYGNVLSRNSLATEEDIDNAYSINQTYGDDFSGKNRILSSEIPIKYVKNYLKNASFEDKTDDFEFNNEKIIKSYSTDKWVSGNRSMKIDVQEAGQKIEQSIAVPKGKYYTFSGYFQTNGKIKIKLMYINGDEEVISSEQEIVATEDFDRNDITIYYDELAKSALKLEIIFLQVGITYIDDVQLEEGEVANGFNMIENSDFSEGFSEWNLNTWTYEEGDIAPNNSFSIAKFNNNKNTALKVSTNPTYGVSFAKILPVKGKKGDLYTCSFWYKNLGIPNFGDIVRSYVSIYFKPIGQDAEYCLATSECFNPNEENWQFFSYRSHAPEDFEAIELKFSIGREANDFYLTNLSLYKNVTSGDYSYDENGNLISITDQSHNTDIFKYDKNNQLISMTDVSGKNFKYEYDNNKVDRVLNVISSSGVSNRVIYDENGNPIITRTSKRYKDEITNGLYKIRNKGTNKYLKAEVNMVLLEENSCSNTVWKLEKYGNYYKIRYNVIPDYTISYRYGKVVLDKIDSNNLFELEKNLDSQNGTYYIKYNEAISTGTNVRFLTVKDGVIEAETYKESSYNIEFYIEVCEELFIENSAEYTEDSRFVKKVMDSDFKEIVYDADINTGLLTFITNPNGKRTEYTHNDKRQLTQVKYIDKTINYEYSNNLISKICQNNKNFGLVYDNFLNVSKVTLNDNIDLINNKYDISSKLLKSTYGNGDVISFDYDRFDRVSKVVKMDNIGQYNYDNNGHIAKIDSNYNNYKYYYDISNRLYKFLDNDLRIDIYYDDDNFITEKKYKLINEEHFFAIDYVDYLPKNTNFDSGTITYSYDVLDRVETKNINNLYTINYKYKSNGKRTTSIIEECIVNNNKYRYNYDQLGNIVDIYYNDNLMNHYDYDDYNELIKEIDYSLDNYIEYTYDIAGNMTKKVTKKREDNSILEEHSYLYNSSNWEDQLTSYDNEIVEYDAIGNATRIGNSKLSWINGKELREYSDVSKDLLINYKYDIDGKRIAKTINGVETRYYLDGNNIIFEKTNDKVIYYIYDLDGIIGLNFNNQNYYYVKNYHNDIIGIMNDVGEIIVSYTYDSWGNLISIRDATNNEITDNNHIGIINPFRYRSYYYDKETNLYYLNTRYYNPKWGRFISPDTVIGINQDPLANNLYLYVSNNPINNIDNNGNLSLGLQILGAAAALAKTSKKKKSKQKASIAQTINQIARKIIPNITTTTTVNVLNTGYGFFGIKYSNETDSSVSSTIHDSDLPITIDYGYDPTDIFATSISLQLTGKEGTIAKSSGFGSSAIRYEGNYDKYGKRKVWEVGSDLFNIYIQEGTESLEENGKSVYTYNKITISKLVVLVAVFSPKVATGMGMYKLLRTAVGALANAGA